MWENMISKNLDKEANYRQMIYISNEIEIQIFTNTCYTVQRVHVRIKKFDCYLFSLEKHAQ